MATPVQVTLFESPQLPNHDTAISILETAGVDEVVKYLRVCGMQPDFISKWIINYRLNQDWVDLWSGFEAKGRMVYFDEVIHGHRLSVIEPDNGSIYLQIDPLGVENSPYKNRFDTVLLSWDEDDMMDGAMMRKIKAAVRQKVYEFLLLMNQ